MSKQDNPNTSSGAADSASGQNAATYFIQHKTTSWMMTLILLVGGVTAYLGLGQLEDPEFTLKQALVLTNYPGASALQVEEEVTYPLENAIQQLPYVDKVDSISKSGLSQITVSMQSTYDSNDLPQIWDELRRKVNDYQPYLPPGVSTPRVIDDFGDVFGILLSVTGDGYSLQEVNDYVDYLRRELVLVEGVGKVSKAGEPSLQVSVEISHEKLANLGIPVSRLYQLLQSQNSVVEAGKVRVGSEYIRIYPTGEFASVEELGNLLISAPGEKELIYLKDVAVVSKKEQEIPSQLVSYMGEPSVHVGISFSSGVNVVEVGEAVNARMAELKRHQPVGMNIDYLYNQPAEVDRSVADFIFNLLAAVAIVFVVLLLFMGLKSGAIIGMVLFLTILGTLIFMLLFEINLHRISLGALIIALGMLVDNAIVVTEGILVGMKKGQSRLEAGYQVVSQTQWPLLGATIIAIAAFAPIGLSPDATGEFAGSLFYVLLISLFLSWVTAITITPFFCDLLLGKEAENASDEDPYKGLLFDSYKALLDAAMRNRVVSMVLMVALLAASVVGFGFVRQSFFPPSTTPMFLMDYWLPEGTDIRATSEQILEIENFVSQDDRVEYVASTVGQGELRFMLTYAVERRYDAYGQLMIRVHEREQISQLIADLRDHIGGRYPDAQVKFKRLEIGPSTPAKIEARFTGPDPEVLRTLIAEAEKIFLEEKGTTNIRNNWRERVKVLRPNFDEARARRLGISRQDLDDVLQMSFSGKTIGLYRESTDVMPIVISPPKASRMDVDSIMEIQIFSPVFNRYVPIQQVVKSFDVVWEDPLIMRLDRKRTMTLMADPDVLSDMTTASLFAKLKPKLEAMELPADYELTWGGEFEAQTDAEKSLFGSLPLGYLFMFIITVLLFNEFKSALVIWACVPLSIIGITAGMLITRAEFGFMSLLGMLSLSGMIIKNGIVLLDQINVELREGKDAYKAVVHASVSRVRPVCMAAVTTILGMLPLLADAFFASMAVVITFGLGFATILTLVIVPVLYSMTHKIEYKKLN